MWWVGFQLKGKVKDKDRERSVEATAVRVMAAVMKINRNGLIQKLLGVSGAPGKGMGAGGERHRSATEAADN